MPTNIINDPFTPISPPAVGNADLPAAVFPTIPRIQHLDSVGPEVTNPQPAALERRTETLRAKINQIIAFCNALDEIFLRKDGTEQKDTFVGMVGDLYLGNDSLQHKIKKLRAGTIAADSLDGVNGAQLYAIVQQLNAISVTLTAGSWSITNDGAGKLKLVNDSTAPGPYMFYGTNSSGVKGWYQQIIQPNHVQTFLVNAGTNVTDATQTFTVPANVFYLWVLTEGARGGNGGNATGGWQAGAPGAAGGRAMSRIQVTPGQVFSIIVGKRGPDGFALHADEWPGGGGGGGCLSRVIRLSDNKLQAGGGGGGGGGGGIAGNSQTGGDGGDGGKHAIARFNSPSQDAGQPWTGGSTLTHDSLSDYGGPGGHGGNAYGAGGSFGPAAGTVGSKHFDNVYLELPGTDTTFSGDIALSGNGLVTLRWYAP